MESGSVIIDGLVSVVVVFPNAASRCAFGFECGFLLAAWRDTRGRWFHWRMMNQAAWLICLLACTTSAYIRGSPHGTYSSYGDPYLRTNPHVNLKERGNILGDLRVDNTPSYAATLNALDTAAEIELQKIAALSEPFVTPVISSLRLAASVTSRGLGRHNNLQTPIKASLCVIITELTDLR